jgi:hypothetical protein
VGAFRSKAGTLIFMRCVYEPQLLCKFVLKPPIMKTVKGIIVYFILMSLSLSAYRGFSQMSVTNSATSVTPQSLFHIHDNHVSGQVFQLTNTTSGNSSASYGFVIQLDPTFKTVFKNQYNNAGAGISFMTNNGALTERVTISNNGNVGIGQSVPGYKLAVGGQLGLLETGATPTYFTVFQSGDLTANRTFTFPADYGTSGYALASDGAGALSWTSREFPLTFSNGLTRLSNAVKLGGALTENTAVTLTGTQTLTFTDGGTGNVVFNLTNTGDFDIQNSGTSSLFVSDAGRIGIGSSIPAAKLHVETSGSEKTGYFAGNGASLTYATLMSENTNTTGGGVAGYFKSAGTDATLILGQGATATGPLFKAFGSNGGEDEFRINTDGTTILYNGNHIRTIQFDPSEGGTTEGGQFTMYNAAGAATIEIDGDYSNLGYGRISTGEMEITGGADLAEPFGVMETADVKPGMVLSIDPENPGKLKISSKEYDPCVAGIRSGASNIKPGLILRQKDTEADGDQLVALSGRVYCLVDATQRAVKPGDLLTTSATPGYAMKVNNFKKAQGAIIGKAMSALPSGKGLVLVLVTLQ